MRGYGQNGRRKDKRKGSEVGRTEVRGDVQRGREVRRRWENVREEENRGEGHRGQDKNREDTRTDKKGEGQRV